MAYTNVPETYGNTPEKPSPWGSSATEVRVDLGIPGYEGYVYLWKSDNRWHQFEEGTEPDPNIFKLN